MRSEVPTLARRSPVTPDRCCTDSSTSVLFENTTIELQGLRLSSGGPHENDCMTSRYFFSLSHPCLSSISTLTSVIVVVGRISARNVPGPLGVARMRIPPHVIRRVGVGGWGSGRTQCALTFSVFRLPDADGHAHIKSGHSLGFWPFDPRPSCRRRPGKKPGAAGRRRRRRRSSLIDICHSEQPAGHCQSGQYGSGAAGSRWSRL